MQNASEFWLNKEIMTFLQMITPPMNKALVLPF